MLVEGLCFMAQGLRRHLTVIWRYISYCNMLTDKSGNGLADWETNFPKGICPTSRQTHFWPQCSDSGKVTSPPSTFPHCDVWEEPLCLPLWPQADLPLPADRALNIASPPVEMSGEQGPLQSRAVIGPWLPRALDSFHLLWRTKL